MADVAAVASIRKWEGRLARRCFRIDYRGEAHRAVYEQVCSLRETVRTDSHYSVYATVIQTSGLGKTRAVLEMSDLGVYLCYCTLPPASSSAYPARTPFLADMLCKEPSEKKMVLYLKSWLMVLDKHLAAGVCARDWMQAQRDDTALFEEVARTWEEQMAAVCGGESSDAGDMDLDRDSANLVLLQKQLEDVEKGLDGMRSEPVGSDLEDEAEVRVVFVFDEAKGRDRLSGRVRHSTT